MTTQPNPLAYQRLVGWLGDRFRRQFIFFLGLTLVLVVINEVAIFDIKIADWDFLFVTGVITFVVALRLAVEFPPKVHETLTRLANRGTLELSADQLTAFEQKLEAEAGRWAAWGGPVIAAAMLLGFYAVFQFKRQIPFTLAATLAGFIAGHFLGRAVAYGRMGALLKQAAIRLRAQPGHLDGAGGFKPVGDLFFYQALVIGLAAAFLAIWWLIIPFLPEYARWRDIYLGLLAIALLFEMLAFFGPMWSFHTEMRAQKARLMEEADRWMEEISRLQSQVVDARTDTDTRSQRERLGLLMDRCRAIDQMPTWPVDAGIRRKFTIGNLGLFLPLLSYFMRLQTPDGQSVWGLLQDILVGLTRD